MATTLVIPGVIYNQFIENSGVPREENWPEPIFRKRGKGEQAVYSSLSENQRRSILTHVECLASCSTGFDADDPGRAAGRTAWRWLEKERTAYEKVRRERSYELRERGFAHGQKAAVPLAERYFDNEPKWAEQEYLYGYAIGAGDPAYAGSDLHPADN